MDVSVGVFAHNEENNIAKLLDSLLGQTQGLRDIIVVSSGSTDKTNELVSNYAKRHKKISLVEQPKRLGKASAINEFLKIASSEILVLASADTLPKKDAVENLCNIFVDNGVGVVASRPVPQTEKNGFLDFVVHLQWNLQHLISLKRGKFGELIAFRNLVKKIPNTAVDEEYIAMSIQKLGYSAAYVPGAVVHNKGPQTVKDFLKQRRRIHCGHLELKKMHGYKAVSMEYLTVMNALYKLLKIKEIPSVVGAVFLEALGRLLGRFDYYFKRENHYIWDIARSAK